MQLQLIRNATLKLNYAGHTLLIDPYFADKLTLRSFTGRSKNPTVNLPLTPEKIVASVELVIVTHLHPDHFDNAAQDALDKQLPIFCQPGDEDKIRGAGFVNVTPLVNDAQWQALQLTRTNARHGSSKAVLALLGSVIGVVLQAPNEPTVYVVSDSVWYEDVQAAIDQFKPDVIVANSGGAVWGDNELIIMDDAQTIALCQYAPDSTIVAAHMEALDHCMTTRQQLRDSAETANISAEQLIIPNDGDILTFDV